MRSAAVPHHIGGWTTTSRVFRGIIAFFFVFIMNNNCINELIRQIAVIQMQFCKSQAESSLRSGRARKFVDDPRLYTERTWASRPNWYRHGIDVFPSISKQLELLQLIATKSNYSHNGAIWDCHSGKKKTQHNIFRFLPSNERIMNSGSHKLLCDVMEFCGN